MTPHEFSMYLEAYQQRIQDEQKMRIVQAYYTALWQRVKKLPALTEILRDKEPKTKKQQTPEEMLAFVKQFQKQLEKSERR